MIFTCTKSLICPAMINLFRTKKLRPMLKITQFFRRGGMYGGKCWIWDAGYGM